MEHNLSAKHGGSVPDIKTHCRLLHYRPYVIEGSILCSGVRMWEPCPDYAKCKKIKPPPQHIPLDPIVRDDFVDAKHKGRGRPRKYVNYDM